MTLMSRLSTPRGTFTPQPELLLTQLAALCWRKADRRPDGPGAPSGPGGPGGPAREVLLVTSSSGRWILPKGWPVAGRSEGEAALREAWEEGGVSRGKLGRRPVGEYLAIKRTPEGDDLPCLHRVFAIKVRETVDEFPEAHRRDRVWVPPEAAAGMVDEDGLRDILRRFAQA